MFKYKKYLNPLAINLITFKMVHYKPKLISILDANNFSNSDLKIAMACATFAT